MNRPRSEWILLSNEPTLSPKRGGGLVEKTNEEDAAHLSASRIAGDHSSYVGSGGCGWFPYSSHHDAGSRPICAATRCGIIAFYAVPNGPMPKGRDQWPRPSWRSIADQRL